MAVNQDILECMIGDTTKEDTEYLKLKGNDKNSTSWLFVLVFLLEEEKQSDTCQFTKYNNYVLMFLKLIMRARPNMN